MNNQIEIKVENTTAYKVIISIMCILGIMVISLSYFMTDVVNYKVTILYIIGVLIAVWGLLKSLLTLVYVSGNEIKYQSALFPFIYRKVNFSNIKKVKMITRMNTSNEGMKGETYDVMLFYGEKRKLFSVLMGTKNCKKLYQVVASYYGIKIEDLRKKDKR